MYISHMRELEEGRSNRSPLILLLYIRTGKKKQNVPVCTALSDAEMHIKERPRAGQGLFLAD
jgi:hypothetical protein